MTSTKKTKIKKSKLASKMAAAAAAGAFMISQEASAQTTVGDAVNLATLNGFSNAIIQPDGSLLVELANGQTFVVPAGDFVQQNGQFLVDQNVLEGLIGADGISPVLLGLGAAAVAGVAIAIASDGDDDDVVVPPVAEDVPAGPTAGDDVLTGTDGDDTIDGLAGDDDISGLAGNDTLIGGAGNDTLSGDAGDDLLVGGGGTDIIDGGDGNGTNSFEGIGSGVTATLAADGTGTADYGMVNETFTGIENLTGSDNDDVLTATGAAANTIFGGAGDDIIAGGGGTDILDGGDGNDTNSFVGIAGDVTASLEDGTASYGMVNETFVNFENLTGSVGDDNLTGDAGANVLDGAEGDDTLIGGAGDDTLIGGDGDDVLVGGGGTDIIDGGAGIDTNSFEGIGLGVTATLAADGTGTADYGMVNESFTGIENLTGTDNDDVLIATGAAANTCLLYTSPSPRDLSTSRMPSSA